MSDYISREDVTKAFIKFSTSAMEGVTYKKIINSVPSADVVSMDVVKQFMWERDMAIEQLKELGYSLGEKPKHNFEEEEE